MRIIPAALPIVFAMLCASPAAAQCLTKPDKPAAALNGKDAYVLAKAEAAKWKADSVLIDMMTPLAGALDAQGRSSMWAFQFFSPGGKQLALISLAAGEMNCSTVDTPVAGTPVAVTGETILDTQRVYELAQAAGGSAMDPKTVAVTADLRDISSAAAWQIIYASPQGRPLLTIDIDSKSGKVTSKDPK